MREAMYYTRLGNGTVRCDLCPRYCSIEPEATGYCRSRSNHEGILIATNYSRAIGGSLDPIEKKPLYHYRPGSHIFSLGPNSCNLSCSFCQNYQVSQQSSPTFEITPDELRSILAEQGSDQVAFTYTEPFTWYEFILDFARQAPEINIVLVTNGFVNPEPLQTILPYIQAMNIDLKSPDDSFYRDQCGGDLQAVLRTIKTVFESGVHLELTNLLIPGLNSSSEQIDRLISLVAEISNDIPLHFSAYHPAYKLKSPPTPHSLVISACESAKQKLRYVYAGNIPFEEHSNSVCYACDMHLISRSGGRVISKVSQQGSCPSCGASIYGVFS